jgi:mono/diheme cytochrome c family protein
MSRLVPWGVAGLMLALLVCGCGRSDAPSASSSAASGAVAAAGAGVATVSKYDSGPRAGESAADGTLAEHGEKLFKTKGCSACHAFGKKMSGPDLQGVSMRRTALWMENQILHPEVMTKEDPISHRLLGEMALQMPNQGLTPDEARAVIEYLKHEDREAGVTTPAASN